MTTKYLVRLADTTVHSEQDHRTTARCTCGWSMTLSGATRAMALQIAGRARSNHLTDAHPDQGLISGPVTTHGHDLLIGGSTKREHLWTRQAVCACGWAESVTERSPDRVATTVRARHRNHLVHETGQAPIRDYVVMVALLAVVTVLLLGLFAVAIHAGRPGTGSEIPRNSDGTMSRTAQAPREANALAAAAADRGQHILQAHPDQAPSKFFRPSAAATRET